MKLQCKEGVLEAEPPSPVIDKKYQFVMPETGQLPYGSKAWAETLFEQSEGDPWGHDWRASQKARYLASIDLIKKYVSPPEVKRVLDIGCALGDFTVMLKEYFKDSHVLAVDISEKAIEKCKRRYHNIHFEVASLPELSLNHRGFDFISALEVIYYVDHNRIEESLKRIYDVLEEGGHLLISTYLNKPPFVTPRNFRTAISRYFVIVDEVIRYHGLYTQYETSIRQSMQDVQKLAQMGYHQSHPILTEYLRTGMKLLQDLNLMNSLNEYARNTIGEKALSHSIILATKKL